MPCSRLGSGIIPHPALSATFDHLTEGVDLKDAYIVGDGDGALAVVQHQLLVAGIPLAFLLDRSFGMR